MKQIAQGNAAALSPPLSPTSPEMRQIARKWELFVTGAEVDLSDVPTVIREAWIRSKQAGVDPGLPHVPWHQIPDDPQILRQEVDWLPCAENAFSLLSTFFTEPHQVVCLVDHQGRLLFIRGGRKGLAVAEKIYAIPGGEWKEKQVGCNIFGTSLYTGLPVQVCWHENYIVSLHEWTSQAAPIHHPLTGEILGVVGVGGHKESAHPRALELVIQAAQMIEGEIQKQETAAHLAVYEHFAQLVARYPGEGLLAVDKHGRILTVNPLLEKTLSLPHARLVGQPVHAIAMLQQRLGNISTVTSVEQLFRHGQASGITLFPVTADQTSGAIILLPQTTTRPPALKKPVVQSWSTTFTFTDLIGQSPLFRDCVIRAQKASLYDWPVLLLGESGTGKELFAQSIHSASPRQYGPFIPLDCAGISDDLIGMELFGYEEGAFTGALKGGKQGKIQLADGGTLFLDDVDNLSPKVQASLLRVLETGQVVPIGGNKPRPTNIRVIAASNGNLEQFVREGKFRQDLYHRLKVVSILLPPLRERVEDIPLLATHVLSQHAPQLDIAEPALVALQQYAWPGNVRELKNVLLEAATYAQGGLITLADLPAAMTSSLVSVSGNSPQRQQVLDSTEADLIKRALQQAGNVPQAAAALGLHHATLYRKLKKYGMTVGTDRKKKAV